MEMLGVMGCGAGRVFFFEVYYFVVCILNNVK